MEYSGDIAVSVSMDKGRQFDDTAAPFVCVGDLAQQYLRCFHQNLCNTSKTERHSTDVLQMIDHAPYVALDTRSSSARYAVSNERVRNRVRPAVDKRTSQWCHSPRGCCRRDLFNIFMRNACPQ